MLANVLKNLRIVTALYKKSAEVYVILAEKRQKRGRNKEGITKKGSTNEAWIAQRTQRALPE